MEVAFIETPLSIQGEQCTVRMHQGDRQGPKVTLISGSYLEITPYPGVWLDGRYFYDESSQEHCWRYDSTHFVGLVAGMRVRILPSLISSVELPKDVEETHEPK